MASRLDIVKRWRGLSRASKVLVVILIVVVIVLAFMLLGPKNLVFYVSNQSDVFPYVNMTVRVSGNEVFSEMLFVADFHNWIEFSVMAWGPVQSIEATCEDAGLTISQDAFTPIQTYVTIDYWGPSQYHNRDTDITIETSLTAPAFM